MSRQLTATGAAITSIKFNLKIGRNVIITQSYPQKAEDVPNSAITLTHPKTLFLTSTVKVLASICCTLEKDKFYFTALEKFNS